MDYLNNLKRSIRILWDNKSLWLLGFIIAFFQGGGGLDLNYDIPSSTSESAGTGEYERFLPDTLKGAYDSWVALDDQVKILLIIIVVIISLATTLLALYLSARAEAGLIRSVSEADDGKAISLRLAWSYGGERAWSLIGLKILLNLPLLIISFILIIFFVTLSLNPMLSAQEQPVIKDPLILILSILLLCFIVVLMLIWAIFAAVITTFASRKIVIEGLGAISSIKKAWGLIKARFSDIFVSFLFSLIIIIPVSFFLFILGFMIGIISFIPALLILLFSSTNLILLICLVILFSILANIFSGLTGSILVLFNSSYWTVVYKDIMKAR